MIKWYLLCGFLCSSLAFLRAQNPIADFTVPATSCLTQRIALENLSTNATAYEWDFCQGDMALSPTAQSVINLAANVTTGIDVVFDGNNWYGFVTNQNDDSILRLDFGSDPRSTPTITNLGNINGVISKPTDIKIVTQNGNWYGFVYCLSGSTMSRINFGNSLSNTTETETPISAAIIVGGAGSTNAGFDMIYDGINWVIVLTRDFSFSCVRLPSLDHMPDNSDIISDIASPFGNNLGDVVIQKFNGNFYAYVVAFGNNTLQRLNFGSNVFSTPGIANLSSVLPDGLSLYGVDVGYDNGSYYLIIATLQGDLIRVNLGSDLTTTPVSAESLGNLLQLENTLKIKLVNSQSKWTAFSPSWQTTNLYRIDFPSPSCSANLEFTTEAKPLVRYASSGNHYVTLKSIDEGVLDQVTKSIVVNSQTSPDIAFTYDGVCVNNISSLTAINASGNIDTYDWDFGDGETLTTVTPSASHSFLSTGDFEVSVIVTASNGCKNFVRDTVRIYGPPSPSFTVPSGLVCTNNEFTFVNTTTDNYDGNLAYQWYIQDVLASSERDLHWAFTDPGAQSIKLLASIPGCANEVSHIIPSVESGAVIDFSYAGECEDESVRFQNQIVDVVNSITWSIESSQVFNVNEVEHVFVNNGNYEVTLSALSPNGCNNSKTKTVTIYTKPQPDFQISLPPASCSGSITPFDNLTPDPTDSDIATFNWNFGDPENSSLALHEPSFIYANAGDYLVTLSATTDKGCTNTIEKPITITPSPIVSLSSTSACVGVPVQFSASGNNLDSFFWEIGTSYYTSNPMTHTFATPGARDLRLTVGGANDCVTVINQSIPVPAQLSPDFSVVKNCKDERAIFTDVTSGTEPIVIRNWNFNSEGSSEERSPGYTFKTTGNKQVSLTVTTQAGCTYNVSKTIPVVERPVAVFSATNEIAVPPIDILFTNQSTNATHYQWTFETPSGIETSTEISPSFNFEYLGVYEVQLTAINVQTCEDVETSSVTLESPLPDVDLKSISATANPDGSLKVIITIENKGNTILRNLPVLVDLSGYITLTKTVAENIDPGEMHNVVLDYAINPSSGLDFLCASVDLDGDLHPSGNRICKNFEESIIISPVYPNPVYDRLIIEWVGNGGENVTAVLVDRLGRIVWSMETTSQDGLNQVTWNTRHLLHGIYFLTIRGNSETGMRAQRTQRIFISTQN